MVLASLGMDGNANTTGTQNVNTVPAPADPGVTVVSGATTDTVTLRVPQDSTKKFARLKVVITP